LRPIGKLAAATGVKVPTIRFYEEIGLLPPPPRTASDRRMYDDAAERRLSFIRHARQLGFDLDSIRSLLDLSDHPDRPCAEASTLAADQADAAGGPLPLPELTDARQRNDHRSAHAAYPGAELQRQAVDRRSQAREAWAALQTHQALARLTQDLDLPQQEALEQAVLQRYNGMFVSTWELLAAARERLAALDRLTDARLAYWQAEADWRALLAGGEYAGAQSANSPSTPGGNAAPGH
jgi:DNA-binding transcriptional MerR regulator